MLASKVIKDIRQVIAETEGDLSKLELKLPVAINGDIPRHELMYQLRALIIKNKIVRVRLTHFYNDFFANANENLSMLIVFLKSLGIKKIYFDLGEGDYNKNIERFQEIIHRFIRSHGPGIKYRFSEFTATDVLDELAVVREKSEINLPALITEMDIPHQDYFNRLRQLILDKNPSRVNIINCPFSFFSQKARSCALLDLLASAGVTWVYFQSANAYVASHHKEMQRHVEGKAMKVRFSGDRYDNENMLLDALEDDLEKGKLSLPVSHKNISIFKVLSSSRWPVLLREKEVQEIMLTHWDKEFFVGTNLERLFNYLEAASIKKVYLMITHANFSDTCFRQLVQQAKRFSSICFSCTDTAWNQKLQSIYSAQNKKTSLLEELGQFSHARLASPPVGIEEANALRALTH